MPQSYHIEEIVQQDASSVVYLALDTSSSQLVALRRFFPFGIDGGGLEPDEQAAYQTALERLAAISHPSLRPILGGGCDPVDGIPFIVTQWVEGLTLRDAVSGGEPDVQLAMEWLMQALEVSELLSHILNQQAIWVESDPDTILISDETDGYRASFRISPLKWLSGSQEPTLQPIVELTESIMGWTGKVVGDHAARGMGGWLRWLRDAPPATPLQEVREMLAASVGVDPPAPTSKLVKHAIVAGHQQMQHRRAQIRVTSKSSPAKWPAISVALLIAASLGLGAWIYVRPPTTPRNPTAVNTPAADSAESADSWEADSSDPTEVLPTSHDETTAEQASQPRPAAPDGPVFTPGDSSLLMQKAGQVVTFEAVLISVEKTSNKGLLLNFSEKSNKSAPRGYISPRNAIGKLSLAEIKGLQGKKLQFQGMIGTRNRRPDIEIRNPNSIHVVE